MTAEEVVAALQSRAWILSTAESCTGGLVAGAITSVAGSSDVFDCGFVTYSNTAKARVLGVPPALILQYGAVSEQVARAMAVGAIENSRANIAVAITGIAGPGGGSAAKPVGLVHFACAVRGGATIHAECQFGDIGRNEVRQAAISQALQMVLDQARA